MSCRPRSRGLGLPLGLFIVFWAAAAAAAAVAAASTLAVSAPLYVALVRLSELAPYNASSARPIRSRAALLRAAGYPLTAALSTPPLARALDAAVAESAAPGGAWALPEPTGPDGPTLNPGSSGSSDSRDSSSGGSSRAATQAPGQRRRLQRQQQQVSAAAGRGLDGVAVGAPAGTSSLAAGPRHLLQAAGPVVTITNLSSSTGEVLPGSSRSVALALLLAGAAVDCAGVFDPSAAYDHQAGRFLLAASCGGQGRVLLAASATSDAAGAWHVFGLVADGVGTPLACQYPVEESTLADYPQVGYNADGVFVTYKSICPSNTTNTGVGLLALPKHALYAGKINFVFPVFSSADLEQAVAEGGSASAACSQLTPVLPQGPGDVLPDSAYFVCEVPVTAPVPASPRKTLLVVGLLDTATLWQFVSPELHSQVPLVVARRVTLEAPALPPVAAGLVLQQPGGAPPLGFSPAPRGFLNGGAVLSGGKLFLASPTIVSGDRESPAYSRRPAVAWAELSLTPATSGVDACAQSTAGRATRDTWDWSTDHSVDWGSQLDANFSQHTSATFAPRLARDVKAATSSTAISSSQTRVVRAALLWGLGFELGVEPCSCYACYWGGNYYQYGGYNTGALGGTGYGFTSAGYYFAQGRMTRCQNTCTRCWYYGYPGNGAGNLGSDLANVIPVPPRIRSVNGQLTLVNGTGSAVGSSITALDGVTDLTGLLTPCARSGSLAVQAVRQGVISQGGTQPLGLTYPAIAAGPSGQVLVTFSFAGPANATSAGTPAYLGVGAALIPPGGTSGSVTVVQPGRGTIRPATAGSVRGDWAELSAVAAHPGSGRVFTAAHYASAATSLSNVVGSWIQSWVLL